LHFYCLIKFIIQRILTNLVFKFCLKNINLIKQFFLLIFKILLFNYNFIILVTYNVSMKRLSQWMTWSRAQLYFYSERRKLILFSVFSDIFFSSFFPIIRFPVHIHEIFYQWRCIIRRPGLSALYIKGICLLSQGTEYQLCFEFGRLITTAWLCIPTPIYATFRAISIRDKCRLIA